MLSIILHAFKTSTTWMALELQSSAASAVEVEFYAMSVTWCLLRVFMHTSENSSGNIGNMLNANTFLFLLLFNQLDTDVTRVI